MSGLCGRRRWIRLDFAPVNGAEPTADRGRGLVVGR